MASGNGRSKPTQERLQHALARLQREPRRGERRLGDRRRTALILRPYGHERRTYAERRTVERRVLQPY